MFAVARDITERKKQKRSSPTTTRCWSEPLAERTAELEEARWETLRCLALAAEYRDDQTYEHTQRVGRTVQLLAERLGLAPQARRADPPCRAAARRRQARDPRLDPAQARQAHRRRVRACPRTRRRGRPHPRPEQLRAAQTRRGDRAHPPRMVGRHRLPERPRRRADPAQRTHRRRRRRLRRAHPRTPLQAGLDRRRLRPGDATAYRTAVRPDSHGRLQAA